MAAESLTQPQSTVKVCRRKSRGLRLPLVQFCLGKG